VVAGRALLRPEEILTLNNDYVIVLQRGMSPILAERVKWYQDPEFNPALPRPRTRWLHWNTGHWQWRLLAAGILALILIALAQRAHPRQVLLNVAR